MKAHRTAGAAAEGDSPTGAPPGRTEAVTGARALAHPIRARIFACLAAGEMSPIELAKALDVRLGVVSYHVRALAEAGVLELSRTAARRGAIQHYYRRASHVGRYFESVEVSERVADDLLADLASAISRAQRRSAAKGASPDPRVLVTVVVQPQADA